MQAGAALADVAPGLVDRLRAFDRRPGCAAAVRPVHGGPPVVAAGAPWFMTLFGRDSILTSWMAMPVDPTLGYGVARALADLQGHRDDADSEEEPGRILHEVRFVDATNPSFRDGHPYYGTVDATPLFVMLVGELSRWGLPDDSAGAVAAARRPGDGMDREPGRDGGYLSLPPYHAARARQPRVEGLVGRHPLPRRASRRGAHRAVGGPGLRVRRSSRPGRAGADGSTTTRGRRASGTLPTS